jgi:hypothetical protein
MRERRVRLAVKQEIIFLQVRAIRLYQNQNFENLNDEELEANTIEYEEIVNKIENHIAFLAITKKID